MCFFVIRSVVGVGADAVGRLFNVLQIFFEDDVVKLPLCSYC